MKNLTRRIATSIRKFLRGYHQRLRKKALAADFRHTFRQLECRRVLSVTGVFDNVTGSLAVTIAAGGNTNGALLVDGNDFFVDENGNLARDPGDESGLLTDLKQIQVNSAPGVGTFAWRGDFSTSNLLQSLLVQNVSSTSIGATASLLGNLSVSSATSIVFESTAAINTGGTADLSGGSIQFNAGSSLDAASNITLQANGVNSDIQMNGSLQTTDGSINLTAPDSILFGPTGSLDAGNNGNVTLTANSDALNGNGIDGIQMSDGSSIQVANGTIRLSALNAFAGDITLGELVADTNAGTAIEVRSAGNIIDGTALDTNLAADANLQANFGTILLQSTGGSIGAGAAASDIDMNSQGLVFNSPGIVQITDVTGGVQVNDTSSALGGGFLAANSPLTISADVNVGASMAFTAGDSALPGDDLTIDSGAIVTLTSAAAGVLTFNAGDSIRFNSGRIVTTGGGLHAVQLSADLDNAGVGAADGDRGVILGDGTAIVEVSTDNLTANAANGIDIDTTVATLTASNTVTGGIVVRETDGIVLTSVTSTAGSIDVTAAGSITATSVVTNVAGDVVLVSTSGDVGVGLVQANAGNVTITAQNNIIDTDPLPDSLVFDIVGNDITLTANTGNIGSTSSDIFREQVNPIEISAAGNYTATALLGMIAINLDATNALAIATTANTLWYQSNGDIIVAGLTLANNLALIADADNDGAGTLFLGNSLAVPGDLRVEGADISAADGSIDLSANRMMVYSGQTEILFVDTNQLDATTNGDLSVFANNSIELIDLAAPFQVDHNPVIPPIDRDNVALQTLGNGFLFVQANGSITVSDDVIAGNDAIQTSAGSVRLQALAANGNVIINDTILSDRGDIVIEASQDILVDGAIGATEALDTDNLALVTSTTGNITLRADLDASSNGAITMADGTRVIAGRNTLAIYDPGLNGNPSPTAFSLGAGAQLAGFAEIRLFAFGSIALGSLQSENVGSASVSVQSTNGSIVDNTAAETSNLITAGTATLSAAQGIGAAGAADIDTTIGTLVATNTTSGDIFVHETNGLTIGGTGVRTLAGGGNINIDVDAGNLAVNSVVTANGAGTLALNADAGTIALSAAVSSTSGAISITGDAVNQNAGGNIATGGAGTVAVTADNGSIVMADGTTATTANGVIDYSATLNVALSRLSSTDATINVTADSDLNLTGAITDSSAAETPNLITTGTAVLVAAQGIGAAAAADIDTTIGTLVATNSTSGSIFIHETDGLIIAGTGVRTLGGSGNINVDVDAGNLTVNSVVTADGAGTVTLNADVGTIDLNAAVSSGSGAIAITGDIVNQNAGGNISTGGPGTATVIADNGNITMADGTTTTTINGAINYTATGDVLLSQLISTNGSIDVTADSDGDGAGLIVDNTAAETSNLITAGTATLSAAQGIGAAGAADIDTTIGTLVATNTTSGDIFVHETNGLTIGGTGVRTLAGGGNINIDVDAGNLAVNSVVTANGAGTLALNADAGTIALSAAVSSTSGAISITGDAVNQNAGGNIATGGAGTVAVTADNGSIVMADGTTATTANGVIDYSATLNVALSRLSSTDATINVTADSDLNGTGAITDNSVAETANLVTTGTAVLVAAQGIGAAAAADIDTTIGTLVATNSTSGSIFVHETDGLIIAGTGVRTLGGSGNINVDVDAGNLTVNSVVTADGAGTVTLNADVGTIDLNAAVSSGSGEIAITGDIVNQNAGGNISTGGPGTATVIADTGNITMADGTTTTTINGAINYTATGNVLLSQLISTNGSIDVTADSDGDGAGSIVDNTAAETSNLITAGTATLSAAQGIGAAGAADIDTTIGTLVATNTTSGGIFVQETNGLTIGGTGVRTIGGNGNIVIDVLAGNLTVDSLVAANGAGNVLLQTQAADGDIIANAVVQSGSGNVSLLAGDDIALNSNISAGGTGTVYLLADNATADLTSGVDMASGASVTTTGGNVRVLAQNNGDIRLARIDVASGNVSLIASRSILDANGASLNVSANQLRMVATNGTIGGSDLLNGTPDINVNAIDTQVSILAATSATGIYIREADGLTVDNTVAIDVQQVNVDASTTAVSDSTLEDLSTSIDGPIKLQSLTGDIVINSGTLVPFGIQANGTGDVLLQTLAANGDIVVNGVVRSGTGHISLVSGDDVRVNANILTSGAGSIFLVGNNATADGPTSVEMLSGTNLTTAGGNVRLVTGNNGNILLGLIDAGAGNASLIASGSILDSNGATVNVIANALRMVATNGSIGQGDPLNGTPDVNVRAIDTQVLILAASSATGIHVLETDGVTIDNTGAIGVQKVNFNSTQTAVVDSSAEDLTTSNSGPIKLLSLAGNIVVNSGTAATQAIQANGTGDILMQTQAANGDISINGGVLSQSGHITLKSGDDVKLNANVATGGAGTVYLLASNATADAINGVNMDAAASVSTVGGNIRIVAQNGDVRLGLVDAGNGNVSINARGSVVDANGDALNIAASNLRLQAETGALGAALDAIETRVTVIAANSVSGIFVFENNGVRVDDTGAISVQQVNFNSTQQLITDASLEDLQTANGSIHLRSATGDIVINSGTDGTFGVNAEGAGNDVTLQVEATVGPQSGNIVLNTLARAADDLTLISKGGWIDEGNAAASVQGDLLTINAAQYAHLHNTQVNQLAASTGRNQVLNAGVGQLVNSNASNAGDDFLSNLSTGIADPVSLTGGSNPSNFQFADKYSAAGYSLYIVNGRSLEVNSLSAGTTSLSVSPNIYIETQGASNLIVSGAVVTQSSNSEEGGIVLVAGAKFTLNPTGQLETHTAVPAVNQLVKQVGPIAGSLTPASYLDAEFFEGGEGSDPDMRSTKFVLHQFSLASETPLRHVNQRVAVQFGFSGESGFVTLIGYADGGQPRVFDTVGEQGKLPLDSANPAAINSFPNSAANNAIFTRPEPFNDAFLTANNVLLTNVVVRRSSDFFVFENASEAGGTPVKDLTFEYKQIKAFTEGDNSAVDLPAGPPALPIPIPGTFVLPQEIQNPISIRPPQIEFADFVDKPIQVFVYPITYKDLNRDGQPDLNELPLEKEVLESLSKLKPIDEIVSPDGGSPTPQQIDTKKAELLRDPQLPSGAYAIVEKDADGKEVVIDVFPIRDWESESSDVSNEMPLIPSKEESGEKKSEPSDDLIVPRPKTKDSEAMVVPTIDSKHDGSQLSDDASLVPSANKSRFASVGMMFGSLWVLREATKSEAKPTDQAFEELGTVGFSRSERRKRRTAGQPFSQT